MTSTKEELIELSDNEEGVADDQRNHPETDAKDETPGFIPLVPTTKAEELNNLSFKITEVKTLTGASVGLIGRPKNIRYRQLPTGQRMKIVPPRYSLDTPSSSTSKTSQTQKTKSDPTQTPNTSTSASRKRKSTHITKPVNDITFEETVEVEVTENTELMEYVACLRVALNNLLTEVDLPTINLPGAVGKVKISDKVEQLIKERKESLNLEKEQKTQRNKPGPKSKMRQTM